MMKMFFFYLFCLSLLFMNLYIIMSTHLHPIFMILLILLYTLSICFMMSLWQSNSLYPILLFLIMISGLLIIFLYFSSLITNMQNIFSLNFFMLFNFTINLIFFLYLSFNNFNNNSNPLFSYLETQSLSSLNQNMFKNLFLIYSYPFNNFTLLCMLFLLIAMFIIIKMCTIKSSSLRKIS